MSGIDLQVDDDGAVIITIQSGVFPLADMVARALQGKQAKRLVADGEAPQEEDEEAREEEDKPERPNDAILGWIGKHGPCSPKDVREAFPGLKPETVKRSIKALVDAELITATDSTTNRRLERV